MDLQLKPFSTIDLADPFFDSLKKAYPVLSDWYNRKAKEGAEAYVTIFPTEELQGLIELFERNGFRHVAEKTHGAGMAEWVMIRKIV